MLERYKDGDGVSFADHRALLPERAADFPAAGIVRDGEALELIGWRFPRCQVCGERGGNRHHIIGGAGRSDEATNLIVLCGSGNASGCHAEAHGGELTLARILWYKWRQDRANLSWVRLAILRRGHLPRPEPPRKEVADE